MNTRPNIDISREAFIRFEAVRRSGVTNMLSTDVQGLAMISKNEHHEIMRNYDVLKELYKDNLDVEVEPLANELRERWE